VGQVETLHIATLGTILAVAMAFPIGVMAAHNITPSRPLNFIARLLLVSSRSVNSLVWALLFVAVFGPGALAGTLAIAFRSIGFIGKLIGEALEEANKGTIEALTAVGESLFFFAEQKRKDVDKIHFPEYKGSGERKEVEKQKQGSFVYRKGPLPLEEGAKMEAEGRRILRGAEVPDEAVRTRRTAEMHYTGQGHEVEVEVPPGALDAGSLAAITANFESAYRALYSRIPMGVPIEALNWRVVVSGPAPDITVSGVKPVDAAGAAKPAPKATRKAYFSEARGYVDTPVYDRYALVPGATLAGPAIIEERESTTVVGPGARVTVDARLTLVLEEDGL
jgi:hypothetical protein